MQILEGIKGIGKFIEKIPETKNRHPAIVVVEFGGGGCNKADAPSCRDFCAVPTGKLYNPILDPPVETMDKLFSQISLLKPAVLSIVPNGEIVDTTHQSNTKWGKVFELFENKTINRKQKQALEKYYALKNKRALINSEQPMSPAEKIALTIAAGTNNKINISLTSNGSFINKDLIDLYGRMGLQTLNLSYHPNSPFDPTKYNPDLEHLIEKAEETMSADITPTITHVMTRKNADTFVALSDYITEHDILFAVGLAQGKGMAFSVDNESIEPTTDQVKMVFRRLLARRLFADRHIRTTMPYLIMAPYMPHWVCDQTTDFFHISVQFVNGQLIPRLNVCSEVRPNDTAQLEQFLEGGDLDVEKYFKWRSESMKATKNGCPTCINQCYFEAEMRGGTDTENALEMWSHFETVGKALRQKYTFRHSIRPTVSEKGDFQNPYLWESLLQGVARQMASLAGDNYWQETFKRSGINYETLLKTCIEEACDPVIVKDLVEREQQDHKMRLFKTEVTPEKLKVVSFQDKTDWSDSPSWQSRALRGLYLKTQRSGREAGIAVPARYTGILKHENIFDFQREVKNIVEQRQHKSTLIRGKSGRIYPFIKIILEFLTNPVQPRRLFGLAFSKINPAG
ncbi:MAG: hypothetical protein WC557_01835 [Ignavibacteriaceae bacterium]